MLTDIKNLSDLLKMMPAGLSKTEQARFLYIELGKRSYFNTLFKYMSDYEQYEYFNGSSSFKSPNIVICNHLSNQYNYLLQHASIKTRIEQTNFDEFLRIYHPIVFFEDDNGVEHKTDLIYDLSRIQTGSKTAHFAKESITDKDLEDIDLKINYLSQNRFYKDHFWQILKKNIDIFSLPLTDKIHILIEYANKLIDFSKLGPNEQANTFNFLINRIISSDNIKLDRVLSKDKTREEYYISCFEPSVYENISRSTIYYLYDYDSSKYMLTDETALKTKEILKDDFTR